ncbi:MAG: hypothetical protein HN595_07825 [Flavobacteriaceae bacterium]|nr:hypothetical protein [Flavobacteriaceae bacterium]
MKIKLLVVGNTTDSLLKSLILNYKKRIKRYVNFEITELNIFKFRKIILTFSNQIIRLFIVEQLYRDFTIINNHPCHNQ